MKKNILLMTLTALSILAASMAMPAVGTEGRSPEARKPQTRSVKWETSTDFQKRLKPARLPMVEADHSGTLLPADPE